MAGSTESGTPQEGRIVCLSPLAWDVMVEHARGAAPEEACGILVGTRTGGRREVTLAIPCSNVHPGDRRKRFLVDPEQHLAAQRGAREAGLEILGFYHSHHNGSAAMSEEDLAQAHPFVSHFILAFRGGALVQARCWRIGAEGGAAEEEIVIGSVTGGPRAASNTSDGS
jgi:proteasome lid subunit RPN8/RPN11